MLERSLNKYADSLAPTVLRQSDLTLFPLRENQLFEKDCQIFKFAFLTLLVHWVIPCIC